MDIEIVRRSSRGEAPRARQRRLCPSVRLMRNLSGLFASWGWRGYSRLGALLTSGLNPDSDIVVRLSDDVTFSFPANDRYWYRLIVDWYRYEPEVEAFLLSIADRRYSFIDCGANYGYWSALVSSKRFGGNKCIAIEPFQETFMRLQKNVALNSQRIVSERYAVFSEAGIVVRIGGKGHASNSILADSGETVRTTTIDDVVTRHSLEEPFVIKLDIEGVEVEALRGERETMKKDVALVYEDHGNDPSCKVSSYLMGNGWTILAVESDGRITRVNHMEQLRLLKINPRIGYNFVAVNSDRLVSSIA